MIVHALDFDNLSDSDTDQLEAITLAPGFEVWLRLKTSCEIDKALTGTH